jgi:hypothetical protein
VHRRVHVALIDNVDNELRALPNPEYRTRDRPVIREHSYGRAADPFLHRRDPEIELRAIGQFQLIRRMRHGQTCGR